MRVLFSVLMFLFVFTNVHSQERRNINWFTAKSASTDGFKEGQKAPNLSIKNVHNRRFNLHDEVDKITIIEFTSLECASCAKSNKYLKKFYEQYSINIISVYTDKRSLAVKNYAQKNGLIWTNVQDNAPPKELLRKKAGLTGSDPAYLVISPDKKILKVFNSGKDIGRLGVFLQQHFN